MTRRICVSGSAATTITTIEVAIPIHLKEQRNVSDGVRMPRRVERCEPRIGGAAHFRVNDAFECLAGLRVGEHDCGQLVPIEGTSRIEHISSKPLDDRRQARRTWRYGIPCEAVGINRRHAEPLEAFAHVTLAGGNAASECDTAYAERAPATSPAGGLEASGHTRTRAGGPQRVHHQHRHGQRSDAARNRRQRPCDLGDLRVNVADEH